MKIKTPKPKISYGFEPDWQASSVMDAADLLCLEELRATLPDSEVVSGYMPEQLTRWAFTDPGNLSKSAKAWLKKTFGKVVIKTNAKGEEYETIVVTPPKNFFATMKEAQEGLTEPAELCAAAFTVVDRFIGIERWKQDQVNVRRAQRHFYRENTAKVKQPDGSRKWENAELFELPPLRPSNGNGIMHEPCGYAMRIGDVAHDTRMTCGALKPIKRDNPDKALQSLATRFGRRMNGGAMEVLQKMVGRKDIIPAYATIWTKNGWLVIVGWQRDPKLTPSRWIKDVDSNLTYNEKVDDGDEDRLTVSEFEYAVISAPSIESEDDEKATDAYGELSEWFEQSMDMESYRDVINEDDFDQDEALLVSILRSQDFDLSQWHAGSDDLSKTQEMRDCMAQWFRDEKVLYKRSLRLWKDARTAFLNRAKQKTCPSLEDGSVKPTKYASILKDELQGAWEELEENRPRSPMIRLIRAKNALSRLTTPWMENGKQNARLERHAPMPEASKREFVTQEFDPTGSTPDPMQTFSESDTMPSGTAFKLTVTKQGQTIISKGKFKAIPKKTTTSIPNNAKLTKTIKRIGQGKPLRGVRS